MASWMGGLSDEADSTLGLDELLETYLARHVEARSLAEHAAAASGAAIGTSAGKPLSNAITKIFGRNMFARSLGPAA